MAHVQGPKSPNPHILIIGAGITGLLLAQSLKKHNISYAIYERDPDVAHRGRGWGITIHWSLDVFLSLLPQHLIDRLPSIYVNPEASEKGENGNFLFFDLRTGQDRYRVPPAKRIRVSRERLRALLLDGVDVQWSKSLTGLDVSQSSTAVTAQFADSTTATGTLLLGCDGIKSRVRPALLSLSKQEESISQNTSLPIRILGVSATYGPPLTTQLRDIDPFFFQGGDPTSNSFMWFSFLDTPSACKIRTGQDTDLYECQILVSYNVHGSAHQDGLGEAPESNEARLKLMKDLTKEWAEPFRSTVQSIPAQTKVKVISLEDWVPKKDLWNTHGGRVTLLGDSAHAMTMFRGEGANHAITDVAIFMQHLLTTTTTANDSNAVDIQHAIDAYESEMIARSGPAVLTSRRACLDAHDYARINDQSPLVSRRVMIVNEDDAAARS